MISMLLTLLMGLLLLGLVAAGYIVFRAINAWFDRLASEREDKRHAQFMGKMNAAEATLHQLNLPIKSKDMTATETVERMNAKSRGKETLRDEIEAVLRESGALPEGWE